MEGDEWAEEWDLEDEEDVRCSIHLTANEQISWTGTGGAIKGWIERHV